VTWVQIKIDTPVRFPTRLDLTEHVSRECRGELATYTLAGFVVHSGTIEGVHYVSLVRNGGSWLLFNDVHVSALSEDAALEIGNGQTRPRSADLLVYRRTDFATEAESVQIAEELREEIVRENRVNDEYSHLPNAGNVTKYW
jgi:hypothetical protein